VTTPGPEPLLRPLRACRAALPRLVACLTLALFSWLLGCDTGDGPRSAEQEPDVARTRLVLKMQPLWGDLGPFRALLRGFAHENPGVDVAVELIPNASDVAHQYYLTALESGASDIDVMVIDVVWGAEFARAGWLADLSVAFPPARLRQDFLPGPVEAVLLDGRTHAVPWFADVGLLYYRTDLVPRAPRTYRELLTFAREAMAKDHSAASPGDLYGYVFQARQYEGLTCNV
jgi:multiple sugar transport system substrate-binding protein